MKRLILFIAFFFVTSCAHIPNLAVLRGPAHVAIGDNCLEATREIAQSAPNSPLVLKQVNESFQNSKKIRFFDDHVEKKIPDNEFKPGNSYTIIIEEGKLIIGKNIPGNGGIIGGPRSHSTLRDYALIFDVFAMDRHKNSSGAIRIQPDGSIDISGYNTQKQRIKAARAIDKIIKEICDHCQTRFIGKKLSTLESK